MWDSLQSLNHHFDIPWLCAGDFNEIVKQEEKLGGATRNQGWMQLFRDVLDECGFLDLGFVGNRFTWSKHFTDGHFIWERLDRGVVNASWFLKFPGTIVHHLHCTSSDHMPLYINLLGLEVPSRRKLFRFEEMWLSDEHCGEVVKASWSSYHHGFSDNDILKRVDKCGRDLGNVRKELAKKKELLI